MNVFRQISVISVPVITMTALLAIPGCSGEDQKVAPLKSEIESNVKIAIPPFLSLASLETEIIPIMENHVKINFKAKVRPMEDLYIDDRHMRGEAPMMILKKSQSPGTEAQLYGSMEAERATWTNGKCPARNSIPA